jgi:hypothetical protein
MTMTIDSKYELTPSDDSEFNNNYPSDFDNNVADFDLNTAPTEVRSSKQSNKRNYLAKKRIEELHEARRLRKLEDDYYGDWD